DAKRQGIKGKDTTPFLLAHIKEHTKGRSLESNIKLVYNNARVGALISKAYSKLKSK
ncbi:MAG: pseudouridine-5'-phosphate glycosidase, partial [Bacillales bacterium]|nr:pseudouridine-5'-phosphate glycosidase [Bacillales bacterium]